WKSAKMRSGNRMAMGRSSANRTRQPGPCDHMASPWMKRITLGRSIDHAELDWERGDHAAGWSARDLFMDPGPGSGGQPHVHHLGQAEDREHDDLRAGHRRGRPADDR